VHSLVCGLSVELPPFGRNDGGTRCSGRPFDHSTIRPFNHSTTSRWAIRFLPLLEKMFRKHKRTVGESWRMDETYILVKGDWKYLYRAVDKQGKTVDFLLTAQRDKAAAMHFF
jgi:transposase-like protein